MTSASSLHPAGTSEPLDTRFAEGEPFADFLAGVEKNEGLWRGVYERADVPGAFVERVAALPGRWHLLALSADWCGDASNTVPVLARLAERAPNLDLRLLDRDDHLDLMDQHLTDGRSRSIPAVLLLDEGFAEQGWWGPRPAALQAWVMGEGMAMEPADRYKRVRRWYAQDRGVTTLDEVVRGLEQAAGTA